MAKFVVKKRVNGNIIIAKEIEVEYESFMIKCPKDRCPKVGDVGELEICINRFGPSQVKVIEQIDETTFRVKFDQSII